MNKLKEQFEKEIIQECLKLMEQFKEKKIYLVGLGHFVRTQTRNFDINKWTDIQYKELIVKVESDVKITETGGIE